MLYGRTSSPYSCCIQISSHVSIQQLLELFGEVFARLLSNSTLLKHLYNLYILFSTALLKYYIIHIFPQVNFTFHGKKVLHLVS